MKLTITPRTAFFAVVGVTIAVAVGIFIGRLGAGPSSAELAAVKRAAGDSATAAESSRYLREVVAPLNDTITAYKAKAEAAAVVVLRRQGVRVRDTAATTPLAMDVAPAGEPVDVLVVPFATAWQSGVAIAETLTVRPAPMTPTTFARDLTVTFDPDSLTVAFLRLPDGTTRVAAIAAANGYVRATVVDAAIKPRGRSTFDRIVTMTGYVACGVAGIGAGANQWQVGAPAAGVCGLGIIRELLRR